MLHEQSPAISVYDPRIQAADILIQLPGRASRKQGLQHTVLAAEVIREPPTFKK